MTLIPRSHLTLVRARRSMEKAFLQEDWQGVRDWDQTVSFHLNQAFDDPARCHDLLASELEKILALYGRMVQSLPPTTTMDWLRPECRS